MATAQEMDVGQGTGDAADSAGTAPPESCNEESLVRVLIAVPALSAGVADAKGDFDKITVATGKSHASSLTVLGLVHIPEMMVNPNDGLIDLAVVRLGARLEPSSGSDEIAVQAIRLRQERLFRFVKLLAS